MKGNVFLPIERPYKKRQLDWQHVKRTKERNEEPGAKSLGNKHFNKLAFLTPRPDGASTL